MFPTIAVSAAVIAVALRFVIPSNVARSMLQNRDSMTRDGGKQESQNFLYGVFQTRTIIENAILEMPGFCLVLAFLFTGQWWLLQVFAGILIIMVVTFPTTSRIKNFLREQEQQLDFFEGDR